MIRWYEHNDEEFFTFDDVAIVPTYSDQLTRSGISTKVTIRDWSFDAPFISSNMDTVTEEKMAHKMADLGGLAIVHRYMTEARSYAIANSWDRKELVVLSVGSLKSDKKRIDTLIDLNKEENVGLCIDMAHGDHKLAMDTIDYMRKDRGYKGFLVAGNTAVFEGTKRLLDAGADIIRVGIGAGSVCRTRTKTGVGVPQLSSVSHSARAGLVISDGGTKKAADAAKAIAAGASMVMLGGMLAGSDCVPGWDNAMEKAKENYPDPPRIKFRGMASADARKDFFGSWNNEEGISTVVEAKREGSTEAVITELLEGLRSSMSYVGASNLDEFKEKARFIRVSGSTPKENAPHINSK